jgi:ATP-binding cassette subfamily C (CFTR/MRP) protein 1
MFPRHTNNVLVPKERGPHAFFWTVLKTFKWPILAVVPPRAALTAFNFCQPFLIERAIKLSLEPVDKTTTQYGLGLIGAYVFVYCGIAVSIAILISG